MNTSLTILRRLRFATFVVLAAGLGFVSPQARADSPTPKLVKSVPPDYPKQALADGTQGWVEVEFTVATDGSVHDVSVVEADPAMTFEVAAVKAVSKWTFAPATRDGQAIESHARERIDFKL